MMDVILNWPGKLVRNPLTIGAEVPVLDQVIWYLKWWICIENDEFGIIAMDFVLTMIDYVLTMGDFTIKTWHIPGGDPGECQQASHDHN